VLWLVSSVTDSHQRAEVECLKASSDVIFTEPSTAADGYNFTVRPPKLFHFDEANTNQILELMPDGIDLKHFILQHVPPHTPAALRLQFSHLGKALGGWLKRFHEWCTTPSHLRAKIEENNKWAQDIKHMINFGWIYDRIREYPDALGGVADTLAQVEQMVFAERQDPSKFQIIHGDFWTGK
jgi:hypothetical protein